MPASSVPGYLQGYRFANDPAYWDGTSFLDQGPYSALGVSGLEITAGTPAFVTVNGEEGLTLDNTVQGGFLLPIPWEGCVVTVMKPSMGTNGTIYPCIFGAAATAGSNGTIRLVRSSASDYRHQFATAGGATSLYESQGTDAPAVVAFATSQQTRKGYITDDGVTVSESAAVASGANGNGVALGYASGQDYTGHKARFGNLNGTLGNTTATANTCTMFEMHFFKGNPLVDNLAALKTFMDELKDVYGAT